MDGTVIITCLLIIGARITDVTLGTLRTVYVIQGRRGTSWVLGFFEILIWILAVSQVIQNLSYPAYAVSYAFGFASGNYIGMTLEKWLATGRQVVRVFTRKGDRIATQLRSEGFRVTSFRGEGRDGPIDMIFIEIPRRKTSDITLFAREVDPKCYYIIDDVREASLSTIAFQQSTGWRAILKKK